MYVQLKEFLGRCNYLEIIWALIREEIGEDVDNLYCQWSGVLAKSQNLSVWNYLSEALQLLWKSQ
jgi:hypothetical protein